MTNPGGTCEKEGCERPYAARGLCHRHYAARHREHKRQTAREARVAEGRVCRRCNGPIPLDRRKGAVFCSAQCKRGDQYGREKVNPPARRRVLCSIEGCASVVLARGWCSTHYTRWKVRGDVGDPQPKPRRTCSIEGCSRVHDSHGLCGVHRDREKRERERAERLASRAERTCLSCGALLAPDRRSNSMYCSRECKGREYIVAGRAAEASSRSYFRSQYGLDREQMDRMLAEQGGCCAICGTTDPGGRHGAFHVDHDHSTGAVRGLLCSACNLGLGKFGDNSVILRAAADYLERAAALI